jgi:hypothetical protein
VELSGTKLLQIVLGAATIITPIKLKLKARTSFDQECGPRAALAFCMSEKCMMRRKWNFRTLSSSFFFKPLALTPERYSYVSSLDFAIQASQQYQPGEA